MKITNEDGSSLELHWDEENKEPGLYAVIANEDGTVSKHWWPLDPGEASQLLDALDAMTCQAAIETAVEDLDGGKPRN
jgi:hypothetical protein